MWTIYIISGVAMAIGLFTLYAEDIQRWLDKKYPHLKELDDSGEVRVMTSHRTIIKHLRSGDGFIELPDEMLKAIGWGEGTELELTPLEVGDFTLSKPNCHQRCKNDPLTTTEK